MRRGGFVIDREPMGARHRVDREATAGAACTRSRRSGAGRQTTQRAGATSSGALANRGCGTRQAGPPAAPCRLHALLGRRVAVSQLRVLHELRSCDGPTLRRVPRDGARGPTGCPTDRRKSLRRSSRAAATDRASLARHAWSATCMPPRLRSTSTRVTLRKSDSTGCPSARADLPFTRRPSCSISTARSRSTAGSNAPNGSVDPVRLAYRPVAEKCW